MSKELSPLQLERNDTLLRRDLVVETAREYLESSALVRDKEWTEADVGQVKRFLVASAPFAHPKVNSSYWEHLVIASVYARKIAEKAPSLGLDPNEAEALLLLHDIGRLAIPHRYLRNDVVENSIFSRIGVRRGLQDKLPSVPAILGVKIPFVSSDVYSGLEDVPKIQRALDIADNVGKIEGTGDLFDIKVFEDYSRSQPGRYTGGLWPSERVGKRALTMYGKQAFALELELEEIKWLNDELGIEFYALRDEVREELKKPEHQSLILGLKNAQEALDPKLDLELNRPPISRVVWDWGGVLFSGDDDLLLATVAREIGCDPKKISDFLASTPDGGRTGKDANGLPITEEDYMSDLWQHLNLPFPGLARAREIWETPTIQHPFEGMQENVAKLAQNPYIEQWILSDGIPGSAFKINRRNARFYPEFDPEKTLVSSVIGCAKSDSQASAFQELLQRLGQPDPRAILFIDDREAYTNAARTKYNIRAVTFRGDQQKTPTKRIKDQLILNGLIS